MPSREEMLGVIDTEADTARMQVVGDPVRAFEYQWAEQEALKFQTAGYAGTVPGAVSSWAQAKGWTDQQAAEDILAAAAAFRNAMGALRTVRLTGKEAVRNAASDAVAIAAFTQTVAQIKGIRSQIPRS